MEHVYALLDLNVGQCPVTHMIDIDGDETTEVDLAVSVVAQLPDGYWLSIAVEPGDLRPLQ